MSKVTSKDCIEKENNCGAHNYHPLPIVIARGEGVWVWDPEGNKYMDCLASYSALNQGYNHPKIVEAALEQIKTGVTLTSRAFYNTRLGDFLKLVCELTGHSRCLPMNTGAEAVETAIKMARKWGYEKKGIPEGQAEIIAFAGNFHGRTNMVISFSSDEDYRKNFGPFTPGFKIVEFGNFDSFKDAVTENTAAIIIEPIQAEGGIIIPPEGYLKQVSNYCSENKILFMADEIQTGLGRTGKMFACEHEDVVPDVFMLAKAISGGFMPVSIVTADDDVMDVFTPGIHGSTYGGNPLGAAVAIAALNVLVEEKLPERAAELGDYFADEIRKMNSPHVEEVRSRGLLIGVEVKKESGSARPFCEKLMDKGILAKETHDSVIRFAPPLIISKEEIDWALERIAEVLFSDV
ncbi:MAG: ornithine--oxo-acid transaminase [Candidatus Electryonea clarkiae]|nr:ornithine--oxo-acid transaminase [Candidatus Electryonea clarkiae]MDP8287226.1 ornithine--oxo-acid transaminase [Candidatus Electryonea clarkiae]